MFAKNTNMGKLDDAYLKWKTLQPLSNEQQIRLARKFMLDFNFNSNHIEGNTLTYGQTEVLLLLGEVVGTAKMKDCEDMKAHNLCLNLMQKEAVSSDGLHESFIKQLHQVMLREDYTVYRKMSGGQTNSYVIHAGRYKTRPNSVITPTGEYFEYASPEETPSLMYDLICWYNDEDKKSDLTPVQLAALFHYRFIRIHPFEDGNGRIARLLLNFILLRHSYPTVVVLSRKKRAYLNALRIADSKVGPIPFDGANATLHQIVSFEKYMSDLLITDITECISFLNADPLMTWWYNGEVVDFKSPNSIKILNYLKNNPRPTIAELSSVVGINPSAIQKQLTNLSSKGYIVKDANKKNWHVIIMPTTK
jgi:Fic family protein